MPWKKLVVVSSWLLVILFSLFLIPTKQVGATVSACTATVSPSSVTTYSSNSFTISVENTDSVAYSWIRLTIPSSNFTIVGASVPGAWSWSSSESEIVMQNSTLSQGSTQNVNLTVEVRGGTAAASANWTIQVSDDVDGASPFNCSGTLGTEITSGGTDSYAPVISSVAVSDVSQTSVKVTWTTDENANSVVEYGTTDSYGATKSDTTLTTSHSLTLDGLSSNTTYHFNAKSTDSGGNTGESGDYTFVSSKASTTTTVTTTTTTTVTKLVEDTEKPGISFTTKFDKPFSATPEISGKVTDNQGVADVEYSIDGGANYLPVDDLSNPRAKSTNFQFTIISLLDGNYKIRIRATDLTGNVETSAEKILVFDRLPPRVGGAVYTMGSQALQVREDGSLVTIAGLDQKVTLAAVGGPTSVDVISRIGQIGLINDKTLASESQLFSLTKNPDTGLWSGTVSFADPGNYSLQTRAIDGAGNETEGELGKVFVLEKGRILLGSPSQSLGEARGIEIYIYYLEPTTQQFTLWDARAFAQENPVKVDSNLNYSLILPAGKYYLKVISDKLQVTSQIFTFTEATPINTNFELQGLKRLRIGRFSFVLPDIFQPEVEISPISEAWPSQDSVSPMRQTSSMAEELTGKEISYFSLVSEGLTYDSFYFRGKSTVFTFLNTWLPSASEQISILDELSKDTKVNVVVVVPQESESKVDIYRKLGGYEVLMLADPDGVFFGELGIPALPAHIFVDRKGVVEDTIVGVIGEEEILEKIL